VAVQIVMALDVVAIFFDNVVQAHAFQPGIQQNSMAIEDGMDKKSDRRLPNS